MYYVVSTNRRDFYKLLLLLNGYSGDTTLIEISTLFDDIQSERYLQMLFSLLLLYT